MNLFIHARNSGEFLADLLNKILGLVIVPSPSSRAFPRGHADWHRAILWGWVLWAALGLIHSGHLIFYASQVDAQWISPITRKPLSWDFTSLWFGGKLVLSGQSDVLFDLDGFRDAMREAISPDLADSEWIYPPTMLLVAAPLALLPLQVAWIIWTLSGAIALGILLHLLKIPLKALIVLLLSPAVIETFVLGQNGTFTAALFLGALHLAPKRPGWAGLLLGLLTFKPQFGLLVPICLVAARNWRAIGFSAAYGLGFVALTAAIFGPGVWEGFLRSTHPLEMAILEAAFPQTFQTRVVTVFAALQGVTNELWVAYVCQAIVSAIAGVIVYRLWSNSRIDPVLRLATTGALVLLATPYGNSYDMVVVSVSILAASWRVGSAKTAPLGLVWAWPAFTPLFTMHVGPYSAVALIWAAAWLLRLSLSKPDF